MKRFMNLVQYLRESVTTFEVTLVSDTVTPLRVTLGHPMVDPTLLLPHLNILW